MELRTLIYDENKDINDLKVAEKGENYYLE